MSLLPIVLAAGVLAPKAEVNLWVSRNIAPSSKVRLNLNTRNVPVVHVTAFPIDGAKWLLREPENQARPQATGAPVRTWDLTVANPGQRPNPNQADTYYSRQVNLPPLKPGVYLLNVAGGGASAWGVVNVTDLAVVVKRSPTHALVWVTDFATGKVVPNAAVTVIRNEKVEQQVRTGKDGATLFPLGPGGQRFLVRRGADLAGVATTQVDPDGQLRAHFQTDRPIYRPGQRVSFKAILRRTQGQGYAVVAGTSCTVQLRDPKDNPVDELRLTSNAMGSVAGEFPIPSEGMAGAYSLVLKTGNDTAYQTLTVAEYRKPEFKVDVRPLAKRYLAGDEIAFAVDSSYFFGAPVPQAEIRYQVRRSGLMFGVVDPESRYFYSGDGNLYARDTYASDAFVADDRAYTDANGKATIRLKSDPKAGDSTYSITCTVTDASRRQVQGSASVPVYGAAIRLGLSTPLVYAPLGSLVPVTVRTVDLDGKPIAAKVALRLTRSVFDEKKGEWKVVTLTTTSVRTSPAGTHTIQLPAKEAGDLNVEATTTDATGHTARASLGVYVAGNFEPPKKEREEPQVGVRLDRRLYAPGQIAKAFATTNNPGLPMLLVLEGGDLWDYRVIPAAQRGQTWSVPTGVRLSPNAYVAAEQWVKGRLVSGNVLLPVPDRTKAMRVTVTPDKKNYRPGDRATFRVHTADGGGKPLAAEVALSVVDEAIYALSPDTTADLYGLYWGLRPNGVSMQASAPEELSGGAYQRVSAVAPVRQRFEDTAFWGPMVTTDAQGNGSVSFEMPGNLTAWRATARGVTLNTSVGTGSSTVQANRPVTLRLATPRQMVQGDRVTVIGTVDNRSDAAHDFEVRLDSDGVGITNAHTQRLHLPAKRQGKVQWTLDAAQMPANGLASLAGQVEATDAPGADHADALRVGFPIVPNGLPQRTVVGGSVAEEATATLTLPADRIEPASVVTLAVRAGVRPALQAAGDAILHNPRYGSVGAANQLDVAAVTGLGSEAEPVRESLALLSRTQKVDGWGWWESAPTDPVVTARVVSALGNAQRSGIRVFDNLLRAAREAAVARYNATNLWEHRALLATADVLASDRRGKDLVNEVVERGQSLSPYARLRLAEAALLLNDRTRAEALAREALKSATEGPSESYLPAGEGTGWSATDTETTAQALAVLTRLDIQPETQARFVRWLTSPDQAWRSSEENAALVRALALYLGRHPEPSSLGTVTVEVNGKPVEVKPSKFAEMVTANVPRDLLTDGSNTVTIHRSGAGEALYTVEARVYRPVVAESTEGVRVLRRFEVKSAGGVWTELDRPVRPGEPVRCTAVAWGDDLRDAVRVIEPIPAGFEFVEDESGSEGYQEVRDGAVVHYVTNSGLPQTFRYYLRAEAEGTLVALPATAEYLRRPRVRGNSVPLRLEVREVK